MKWDYNNNKLEVDGLIIKLTDIQADILSYFLSKKTRTATRDQLMSILYGNEAINIPQERIIKVHIRRLRKRLKNTMLRIECLNTGKAAKLYKLKRIDK
ncbi:MAG: hypothetical protein COA78_22085 [Blastopirellula sp.]|nr:MAG: hypothetical protein COA78_22085 [Blastopirellula sp.]